MFLQRATATRPLATSLTRFARLATSAEDSCRFGFILDADGVIVRGRELLPGSKEALQMITTVDGQFKIPTVFLTNASNTMRATKAALLSELTGVHIHPAQVVMAHSPLRLFTELHDRPVLVSGQGPVRDIAFAMGFRDVTTVSDLRTFLPHLDVVDSKRRRLQPCKLIDHGFRPIEAILLLGEPINWESSLQLIIDVLLTDGLKELNYQTPKASHIPIIACNLDLFWMGEKGVPMPRFGHGIFLECLQKLYKLLSGHDLYYKWILGKPSEIAYLHAAHCIQSQAAHLGLPAPRRVFAIGDNTESDIVGANLFERYLQTGQKGRFDNQNLIALDKEHFKKTRVQNELKHCFTVLIEKGVEEEKPKMNIIQRSVASMHSRLTHKELEDFKTPAFVEKDLYTAIRAICARERFPL